MTLSLSVPICLSVSLSFFKLSGHHSIYLSVFCSFFCLSFDNPSVCLFIRLSVWYFICPFVPVLSILLSMFYTSLCLCFTHPYVYVWPSFCLCFVKPYFCLSHCMSFSAYLFVFLLSVCLFIQYLSICIDWLLMTLQEKEVGSLTDGIATAIVVIARITAQQQQQLLRKKEMSFSMKARFSNCLFVCLIGIFDICY